MNTPKRITDLTRADRSDAAATGGKQTQPLAATSVESPGAQVSLAAIDISSGGEYILEGAGDRLILLKGDQTYIVEPVEDPAAAYAVYKLSPHLSPILAAISANVYSAQVAFEPYVDLSREESEEVVREALAYEQALAAQNLEADFEIQDSEVEQARKRLSRRQSYERQYLDAWFTRCHPGSTYRALRILVGLDMEIMGSGYVEVLRNTSGKPHHLLWAPAWSVRARPVSQDLIPVREMVPVSKLSWGWEWQLRRFRQYVQIDSNNNVVGVYKEYGDPRVLSRKTGRYYLTLEDMYHQEDEYYEGANGERIPAQPATELLSFQLQTPVNTTYGKPDWTGVYPNLLGSRELEEENRTTLVDQAVPQMFITVAGGSGIDDEVIKNLQESIKQNRAAGKKSIYFLQARTGRTATGTPSPNPDIDIFKTKSEQHTDALGINYQKNSAKTIRTAYRMPKSELGDDEGLSKDQQTFSHRFAEAQVYDPRRDLIDDRINTTLVKDLGCQTVRQKLRPRPPKEPNERAQIVSLLTKAGVLTPDDGRIEAREILDRDYKDLMGAWSKLPSGLLRDVLQTKNQLVAAAILAADEKGDILGRLRTALEGQLGTTEPTRPGQVPVPQGGQLLQAGDEDGGGDDGEQ